LQASGALNHLSIHLRFSNMNREFLRDPEWVQSARHILAAIARQRGEELEKENGP
jgi:hypothetical protein